MTTAYVLRVFTDESGAYGNHLGIVIEDEAPLMAERRQAIAAELGYSETVFFQDVEIGSGETTISAMGAVVPEKIPLAAGTMTNVTIVAR